MFAVLLALVGCDATDPAISTADAGGAAYVSGPSEMKPGATCSFYLVNGTVSSLGWGAHENFTVVSTFGNSALIKANSNNFNDLVFAHSTLGYPVKKRVYVSNSAPDCDF